MKSLLAAGALAVTALLTGVEPASAQREGPWCAHVGIGDDSYIERCDMLSYEMCRNEIFAQGGAYCTQNPRYRPAGSETKKRQPKAQKRNGG
jgi:hypothetical protein